MKIQWHIASALALYALGAPVVACVGAVAPDVSWLYNEARFRASGHVKWEDWICTVSETSIIPYRVFHSFLLTGILLYPISVPLLLGWWLHLAMDLPTHRGRMQQQPFYPFCWRWPWVI